MWVRELPKDVSAETKVFRGLTFIDFVVVLGMYVVFDGFKILVAPQVVFYYTLFTVVLGVALTARSLTNPHRHNFEALLIFIMKDRDIYLPCLVNEEDRIPLIRGRI
jgi:hypothetical protein